jgi:SAM-dependent methyltransferase
MDRRAHWEEVYRTKADADLSWFQERAAVSLELIAGISPRPRSVIDVGGGQSGLAGELLGIGVERVAVLDISGAALERARERMGEAASRVEWIEADVVAEPAPELGRFEFWHDRAVFHFLTGAEERARYAALAARTVMRGGHLVIAAFGPSGPEKCSGLEVRRWDAGSLAAELGAGFELLPGREENHVTPWGKPQAFTYALLRRRT